MEKHTSHFLTIIALVAIVVAVGILMWSFFYIAGFQNGLEKLNCTEDIKICPDGSVVSRNDSISCEFDLCPFEDMEKHFCEPEDRDVNGCPEIYKEVCGWFDPGEIQCITFPCAETFTSDGCSACMNESVLYWTEGNCPR